MADWDVVDAFMTAAREGDFNRRLLRLLRLLRPFAPDAAVTADEAAILAGTPQRIEGRREVATFFSGSARAALSVFVGDPPRLAWFHRGEPMVLSDFTVVVDGVVRGITLRSAPDVPAGGATRRAGTTRGAGTTRLMASSAVMPCDIHHHP